MVISRVFFDFGGTLVRVPPTINRPWNVWVEAARGFDLQLSATLVQHALEATDEELGDRIYQYVGRTQEFWKLHDTSVTDRLRIPHHREELAQAVEATFGDPSKLELFPETREVLENLRSRGFHLGLITNYHDGVLKFVKHFELDKLLETVTYSQEVGCAKPAPGIFAKAVERAKCSPSDALYVGDSIRVDVEGARHSGLYAVWLNREEHAGSVDCPTIHTLAELPHVLEIINGAEEPRS